MKRPAIIVQLIHIHGPLKGEIQEFRKDTIVIGRHPSSDLCFPHDLTIVSRKHAEIIREGNQFRLIDHGANGTFVNGKKISEVFLKDGDVLEFADGGPKVSFLTEMKEIDDIEQPTYQPRTPAPHIPSGPESPSVAGRSVEPGIERPFTKEDVPVQSRRTDQIQPEPASAGDPSPPPTPSMPIEQPMDAIPTVAAPLVIQYGPTIRSYKQVPVSLGRNMRCDFVLDHPGILDQHAQIFHSGDRYWIRDLTGQKMIRINNRPIPFQASLSLDDIVALGPQGPVFRFMGEGRLAEMAPPAAEAQSNTPIAEGTHDPRTRPDGEEEKSSKGVFSRLKKKLF